MLKRLARKPSTASLTPAPTNTTKAIHIVPDAIAQTTIGTNRIRPSVMRFGIFKVIPASRPAPGCPAGSTPFPTVEYNGGGATVRPGVPPPDPPPTEDPVL